VIVHADDPCIATYTGKYVRPLDLDPSDVDIEDIAHSLSNQSRFSGHTTTFYSVAHHSVLVSRLLEGTGHEMWGLLHDGAEAYLTDVARPLKTDPYFGKTYRGAEGRAQRAVAEAFSLPWPEPPEVKVADVILLATERRDLMAAPGRWTVLDGVAPLPGAISPWSPKRSKQMFLARYDQLRRRVGSQRTKEA